MPVNNNVAPVPGYKPAGSFNNDMLAQTKVMNGKSEEGLNDASHSEYTAVFNKDNMAYGMKANFTTDTDMGLISNEGKSGKY
jgi:hypothetical protein|tara:strand:+ start:4276 stop:4521 length:246 start_codon:yes stop_codon:yes gene_type:complete